MLPVINPDHICTGCSQMAWGERRVETDGLGLSRVLVVGDSPWKDEVRAGKPFAGAAGAFLDRIFRRLGYSRENFLITNALWCRPRSLGWTDHPERFPDAALALNHCRPHLDSVIEKFKPKVIVTLGNVALQRVLGASGLENRHGYVCSSSYGIPVVPTFHPSFVMQGKHKYEAAVFYAFRKAMEVAEKNHVPMPTTYFLDDPGGMEAYLDQPEFEVLSVDIETPESGKLDEEQYDEESVSYHIVRAGVSHTSGTACSFPWMEPYISMLRVAMAKARIILMWNQVFDAPRLWAAGMRWRETHDGMWAWHWLQSDLPKGLGFVAPFFIDFEPWKHLNDAQPAFYNATDNDAALRCYLGIRKTLIQQKRWEPWLRHCVQTLPILGRMGRLGITIDRDKQQKLKEQMEREAGEAWNKLQGHIPRAVKPRKTYKKLPKDFDPANYEVREVKCPGCSIGQDQDVEPLV